MKFKDSYLKRILDADSERAFEEILSDIRKARTKGHCKKISFYAPSFMYYRTNSYSSVPHKFPTLSLTGKSCALKCKHCGGKVLDSMYSADTAEQLFDLGLKLKRKGALGLLLSGGCLPDGSVPLRKFIDVIARIKRELGLTVIVHTGIIDFHTAKELRDVGIDAALIDVIGSDETIKEIYKLKATVKTYEDSLKALNDTGIAFVPHVIVGLHYGKLKGELHALEMISRCQPSALVIIAFMPIRGTEMEEVPPPTPLDIAKIAAAARLMFPQTPLALGCMRPKGKHRAKTDILAIKAGVDAIAFPAEEAIKFAQKGKEEIVFSSLCCSQIYTEMKI